MTDILQVDQRFRLQIAIKNVAQLYRLFQITI